MNWPLLCLSSLLLSIAACASNDANSPAVLGQAALPNRVILITIDTLRADRLGFMGYDKALTPNLDRLASEGAFFRNFYGTSSTTPMSMGSIMTGLHPFSHGFTYGSLDSEGLKLTQPILAESHLLLAEFLTSHGHRSFGVSTNPHLSPDHGLGQGLEIFVHTGAYSKAWDINRNAPVTEFKEVLKEGNPPPFFWAHYIDPHDPWHENRHYRDAFEDMPSIEALKPYENRHMTYLRHMYVQPSPEDSERAQWLYSSEISRTDHYVGALLEDLGADDNTLTIITADHGDSFGEHGSFGHGFSLFEELIHIPLIIHWPSRIRGGQEIHTLGSLVDIFPTIAVLLGHEAPPSLPGESLAPLVLGQNSGHLASRPLFADINNKKRPALLKPPKKFRSIRKGDYKLILDYISEDGALSLYNVVEDPGETKDLSQSMPELTQELAQALRAHRESLPPPPNAEPIIRSDEAEIEALKAMGYVE